jgi:hypothetical protein
MLKRRPSAAHLLDVEGNLWQQDHVRATRQPAVQGNPPGIAPHQLDDHHPVVTLRGRVEPVDGLRRSAHGGIEAEGALRSAHVIVDRLGNAHHRQAPFPELVRYLETPVTADGDKGIEPAGLKCRNQVA